MNDATVTAAGGLLLDAHWSADERSNTWVSNEDRTGHRIWLHVDDQTHLAITIQTDGYPAFECSILRIDRDRLAARVRDGYAGWYVRRWNLADTAPVDAEGCLCESLGDEEAS